MKNLVGPVDAVNYIQQQIASPRPKIALVLGSGLNRLADEIQASVRIPYEAIPGFAPCNVAGHQGALLFGTLNGVEVACLQGRAHYYEGHGHEAIQMPVRTLKLLGCETLLLTNAAASLRKEVPPGSLAVINDHINFQFQNPLIGPNQQEFGPRFPSMQNAYDHELIELTSKVAHKLQIPLHTGVYLATFGPCYETPAEIRAFKLLGADMVGMSTVPEVILARHCGMKVLAISTITNMACGMSDELLTHENVLQVAKTAAEKLTQIIKEVVIEIS